MFDKLVLILLIELVLYRNSGTILEVGTGMFNCAIVAVPYLLTS